MCSEEEPVLTPAEGALRLGVLVSGRGSNLEAILDAIKQGKLSARVAVVISNKKDAAALERAARYQVPAIFLDQTHYSRREEYDAAVLQQLKEFGVEFVVLAGYMRLVTPTLIQPYHDRIINTHPSLLPAFPGMHAQRQALSYGVRVSGCTIHFVDEEMDHGPIIAQASVPVFEGDTVEQLSERILAEEHRLLPQVLQLYAEGKLKVDGRKVHIREGASTRSAR
ncbi:MAG: phosphoribosylglycinamide formyltransferase [Candidatus Manganitrophus sp.]|nr:phosphoribosylglycinamide formyltransferase [Candidatus Manganitrophus sp.]WDT71442.1 MAG: phosphoribosylglycinamide formyltransferase [Candidatus Manganitrophus sp.]